MKMGFGNMGNSKVMFNKKIEKAIIETLNDSIIFTRKKSQEELNNCRELYLEFENDTIILIKKGCEFTCHFFYRLKLNFERNCLQAFIVSTEKNIKKNIFTYRIKVKETSYILVDGMRTLVMLTGEKKKINRERQYAEKRKIITHYTDITSLKKILNSRGMFAKSLIAYGTEKGFQVSEESSKLAFIICFSGNRRKSDQMWEQFKDSFQTNTNERCKIDLYLKNGAKTLFDYSKEIYAYKKHGQRIDNLSFGVLGYNKSKPTNESVFIETMIRPVDYIADVCNKVNLEINGKDYIIIDNIARSVRSDYSYQKEIRFIYFLKSVKEYIIEDFKYLFLPFNEEVIEKIIITFNPNFSEKKRELFQQYVEERRTETLYNKVVIKNK